MAKTKNKNKWLTEALDTNKLYGAQGIRKKKFGERTLADYLRKQKAEKKNQSSILTPTPAAEKGMKVVIDDEASRTKRREKIYKRDFKHWREKIKESKKDKKKRKNSDLNKMIS